MKPPLYGAYKIGELAEAAQVSVRTLHYYEEIGLLRPSARTNGNHRLYSLEDALRLQQIKALREMGFSLDEVRECLEDPRYSPIRLIQRKAEDLTEKIRRLEQMRDRLQAVTKKFEGQDSASTEEILEAFEEIAMIEKYYTEEQLQELARRREEVGEERIRQVQQEWSDLYANFTQAMKNGLDPASEEVRKLVEKQRSLINEFTGGNPEIEKSLNRLYEDNPNYLEQYGYKTEPALNEYIHKAVGACGK